MQSGETIHQEVIHWMGRAKRVAVITGAGISAQSGIPTFRGEGGLWRSYRAEDLATPAAFARDPRLVWEWYDWRRSVCRKARPNPGHHALVELEKMVPEFLLITQNVDGLHAEAGSRNMEEIHGNIWKGRCVQCGAVENLLQTPLEEIPPHCGGCGSLLRPHIVWFGESYNGDQISRVMEFLSRTDFLIVVGTSGAVAMPGHLAGYAKERDAQILEINPEESEITHIAHWHVAQPAGEYLPVLVESWKNFL